MAGATVSAPAEGTPAAGPSAGSQRLRIARAVPALVGIFLFGQAILDARAWRLDLTPEKRFTLSDHAVKVLAGLPADVRLTAFLRSQDPRNVMIEDLLRQVTTRTPRVHVETVDVNRSPALARQYGVDSYGAMVAESGGRRRGVSNPREDVLMAALLQVTRQQRKTVSWVVGHGEGDISNSNRLRGYSTARVLLEQEYYEVRPVSLIGDEVPVETDVLVIAGPQKDFLAEELAALDRYLQRPGQALVMIDPQRAPELTAFLRKYDVGLPPEIVADPSARLYGGEYLTMELEASSHPILLPLDAAPLFSLTRSVDSLPAEHGTTAAVTLLSSGQSSWASRDPNVLRSGTPKFVPGRDRTGPIAVGVEVAFRVLTAPGEDPRQGRLIVYGNSEFANNFFIQFLGNKDLFANTINWLARQPEAIAHRPRQQQLGQQQFYVSNEQGSAMFWGTAVLQPALLALVGLALVFRRRWG